ncbi:MAG: DUF1343 domain-containing protein [Calditrichaeota bacterium]|nr:DUF1343 domain-containing protein [Calditrichota bacterium]RQW07576.1 MAG: DUF1343 domain-containing protein [Calditrichota bacterium]
MKKLLVIQILILLLGCQTVDTPAGNIKTGLDNVADYMPLFSGKNVGIIANHTAVNSEGEFITDIFMDTDDVTVGALFGPEHGILGKAEAGATIETEYDTTKQIPVYSLYGSTRKPTPEMLAGLDMLIFDIQDIGARYYTYIYTMALSLEAAAENGIPFVVLDRPNPINGTDVEGNVLDTAFASFVGLLPLPVRHGLTVGELARMFNGEGWLEDGVRANLNVVPITNWKRTMWFDETGLNFIPPSPNMTNLTTATVYPGTCLLEGTNVSEGRGTSIPFLIFGAPWMDGKKVAEELNNLSLDGLSFRDTTFTPAEIPGVSENPKHRGIECSGFVLKNIDRDILQPYFAGISIVNTIHTLYPDSFGWRSAHFDRLCGTDQIRLRLTAGDPPSVIRDSWQSELTDFMKKREKYLLYE